LLARFIFSPGRDPLAELLQPSGHRADDAIHDGFGEPSEQRVFVGGHVVCSSSTGGHHARHHPFTLASHLLPPVHQTAAFVGFVDGAADGKAVSVVGGADSLAD
jgi:hypothetical protein